MPARLFVDAAVIQASRTAGGAKGQGFGQWYRPYPTRMPEQALRSGRRAVQAQNARCNARKHTRCRRLDAVHRRCCAIARTGRRQRLRRCLHSRRYGEARRCRNDPDQVQPSDPAACRCRRITGLRPHRLNPRGDAPIFQRRIAERSFRRQPAINHEFGTSDISRFV